jgi:5-methylcytosine-specific restriction endonuclease McrA
MASLYFFNPESRVIFVDQFYKPLLVEALSLIKQHYHNFELPDFESLKAGFDQDFDEKIYEAYKSCEIEYLRVCHAVYHKDPPGFLRSPFEYLKSEEWGTNPYHNFDVIEAYLTERDWRNVIEDGLEDDMNRVESLDDLWLRWKHSYSTFDLHQNFVYSFFLETVKPGEVKKRGNREKIPSEVKIQVWKRDEGKCVECGSNEKLEYDHIIPISMGGSNTFRNLQLLCEPCNRRKSARI